MIVPYTNQQLEHRHPLRRVSRGLRSWLLMLTVVLIWNAFVANGIVLDGWWRPMPITLLAVVSAAWLMWPWSDRVTIGCASTLAVGLSLRAVEVLLYAEEYDARLRATAASVWVLLAATALVFGFLNLVAISRRHADRHVWGDE